jgi:hypothetical protein
MSGTPDGFRYERLSDEQLLGAHYALRLIRTSPRIRGSALEMLDGQIEACEAEMAARRWNDSLVKTGNDDA